MLRRDFLKGCLGVLSVGVVGIPQIGSSQETKPPFKYRKWAKLEAPTMPLAEGITPVGWKVMYVTRLLNDKIIDRNFTVKKYV